MPKKAAGAPATEPEAPVEQQLAAPATEPEAPAASDPREPPAEPAPAAAVAPPVPPADIEPLTAYAARIEEQAQPLAVCQITHPDAVDGAIHEGKYAGIRLVRGDTPAALLSSGSTI